MKRYLSFFALLSILFPVKGDSQSFTFPPIDTIVYGGVSSIFGSIDTLVNTSSTGFYFDAVRVQNDTAPGWQTSFCIDVCYPPFTDSARVYLLPNAKQVFILDFYSSALPDTSTVLMKFVNVNNPSNIIYQRFYGISQPAGIVEHPASDIVNIFPMPVHSTDAFSFTINEPNSARNNYELLVYDICGKKCGSVTGLVNGNNEISMPLGTGLYSYLLLKNNVPLKTGKIIFTD